MVYLVFTVMGSLTGMVAAAGQESFVRRSILVLMLMLWLVLPPLAGGCRASYFYRARTPQVEVEPIAAVERSEEGTRLVVRLRLSNPNDRELRLLRLRYEVTVPGVGRFALRQNPPVHLPAEGEQVIDLPAAFADPEGLALERRWRLSGRITYDHDGEFRRLQNEAGLPPASVSFSGRGEAAGDAQAPDNAAIDPEGLMRLVHTGSDGTPADRRGLFLPSPPGRGVGGEGRFKPAFDTSPHPSPLPAGEGAGGAGASEPAIVAP